MSLLNFLCKANIFLGDHYFLLFINSVSFAFKVSFFSFFSFKLLKTKKTPFSWICFLIVIASSAVEDFGWIASLLYRTLLPAANYPLILFFVRVAWIANIVSYQAISLFIESFTYKKRISWHQYIFIPISSLFFLFFLSKSVLFYSSRTPLEGLMQKYQAMYGILILIPVTLVVSLQALHKALLPRILRLQLKTAIYYLLTPWLIANFFQVYPFNFILQDIASNPSAVGISAIFLIITLFFCIRKIIGLRFFNIHSHVHATNSEKFNFVNDFKNTLEHLGTITSLNEIQLIVQHFFNHAFSVPITRIHLYIRTIHTSHETSHQNAKSLEKEIMIENFISSELFQKELIAELKDSSMLIKDEYEYNNYYDQTSSKEKIISFLKETNTEIFIPLWDNNKIIASIIIENNAQSDRLYTNIERDEMLIFASYLSKIINLLQNRNLNELLKQRKDIIEELYTKHTEINQYKESIRSFLRTEKENKFGLLFYKNKKFSFGNKDASDMLTFNPNTQASDPLGKNLHNLAQKVEQYKTTQTLFAKDAVGTKLVVTATPHPEKNGVILTLHYPEVSDVFKQLIHFIKDPSNWDYLLYLETTQSGKLINDLIPGNGEILLNFKINLLKAALSKKAILLELPQEDIMPTVELLHHISTRDTLYSLDLQSPVIESNIPIKLFGINPLFGSSTDLPLLERLNKTGTLFIKNIHYLDKESQEELAHFINYGFYHIYKSEKKVQSDVRIICSSNQNLSNLVEKGTFSKNLFNAIYATALNFPSLLTLPLNEMETLLAGFSQQALIGQDIANIKLLMLNDKDREKIINNKPISLHELKVRIQNILLIKTKKNDALRDTYFDPAYNVSDPKLIEAARLGKYALKDPKIMSLLWDKFKNQNKIALFLGVNRSSVYRRCKDYGLGE